MDRYGSGTGRKACLLRTKTKSYDTKPTNKQIAIISISTFGHLHVQIQYGFLKNVAKATHAACKVSNLGEDWPALLCHAGTSPQCMLCCLRCHGKRQPPLAFELLPRVLLLFWQLQQQPDTGGKQIRRAPGFNQTNNPRARKRDLIITHTYAKELLIPLSDGGRTGEWPGQDLPHLVAHPIPHHQQALETQNLHPPLGPEIE